MTSREELGSLAAFTQGDERDKDFADGSYSANSGRVKPGHTRAGDSNDRELRRAMETQIDEGALDTDRDELRTIVRLLAAEAAQRGKE